MQRSKYSICKYSNILVTFLNTLGIEQFQNTGRSLGSGRSLLQEVAVAHLRAVGPVPGQAATPRLPHLQLCLVVHPVKVINTFAPLLC